jgi:hypothetical protein
LANGLPPGLGSQQALVTDQTDKRPGRWPDFIGIGAIKSGTTWLHACLAEHPDIFTPPTKELEFFTLRYELGDAWYRGLFADAGDRLAGESTPAYLHDRRCAERIHAANPGAKLIVCLRNPADRAFSHFMMKNRESRSPATEKIRRFDATIRESGNDYVACGLYAEQLRPYLERFGRANMIVILYDDIAADPTSVIARVYDFLGVDAGFVPDALHRRINPAARYRNAAAFAWLRKAVQFTEQRLFSRLILWMKTSGLRDRVLDWWRIPEANVQMLPQSREFLDRFYAEPNLELERLLDLDLSAWRLPVTPDQA